MPALLGSAMIAFGFIPAACVLYNQKPEILIETGPIAREVNHSFYSLLFNFSISHFSLIINLSTC